MRTYVRPCVPCAPASCLSPEPTRLAYTGFHTSRLSCLHPRSPLRSTAVRRCWLAHARVCGAIRRGSTGWQHEPRSSERVCLWGFRDGPRRPPLWCTRAHLANAYRHGTELTIRWTQWGQSRGDDRPSRGHTQTHAPADVVVLDHLALHHNLRPRQGGPVGGPSAPTRMYCIAASGPRQGSHVVCLAL